MMDGLVITIGSVRQPQRPDSVLFKVGAFELLIAVGM